MIDFSFHDIHSLESTDSRIRHVRVAGPAALLVAKLTKLTKTHERLESSSGKTRIRSKDALDIFRILETIPTLDLVVGIYAPSGETNAWRTTVEAIQFARNDQEKREPKLKRLAVLATGDEQLGESMSVLLQDLLNALPDGG